MRIDGELLDTLVKMVVEKKVEVDMNVTPDGVEVRIEPWKPHEVKCPYDRSGCTDG